MNYISANTIINAHADCIEMLIGIKKKMETYLCDDLYNKNTNPNLNIINTYFKPTKNPNGNLISVCSTNCKLKYSLTEFNKLPSIYTTVGFMRGADDIYIKEGHFEIKNLKKHMDAVNRRARALSQIA